MVQLKNYTTTVTLGRAELTAGDDDGDGDGDDHGDGDGDDDDDSDGDDGDGGSDGDEDCFQPPARIVRNCKQSA